MCCPIKATTSCKLTPGINECRLHEETSLVWNEMQFHFDNLKVWSHGGVVIGSYGFRSQGLHPVIALLLWMKNSIHVVSLDLGVEMDEGEILLGEGGVI